MESVTARLPRDMLGELEKLAREEQVDRSELIRRLIDHALKQKRVERALNAYSEGRVTLWKAAEMAGLSLRAMMEVVKASKTLVPYGLEELERDIAYVKKETSRQ